MSVAVSMLLLLMVVVVMVAAAAAVAVCPVLLGIVSKNYFITYLSRSRIFRIRLLEIRTPKVITDDDTNSNTEHILSEDVQYKTNHQ